MSRLDHRTAPGSSYFVTTRCWQGRAIFQVPEIAEILLATIFKYRDAGSYALHEFVVMPNHLHLLITPGQAISLEKDIQLIKGGSSYQIHKDRRHKMEIWQQGFHDWTIRDFDDWQAKAEYIRQNPVRAKLVQRAQDWPYSSAIAAFAIDPSPAKYLEQLSSGAKAQLARPLTSGLKPRPPKERAIATNVRPKGPFPVALSAKATRQ
jgi:putative transposase